MRISFLMLFIWITQMSAQTYPPYHVNVCNSASRGYYFLDAITISQFATGNPTQMILDSTGHVIWYRPISNGGGDFKIQRNGGLMSYAYNNKFFLMDSTFTIVDSVACVNGYTTDTHDLQIEPNGNFLLLGTEIFVTDLSMYHIFGPNHTSPGSTSANLKCGLIQELDPARNVVFEWHAHDHFNFMDVDPIWLFTPNVVDWNHCNAIDLDNDGNILLSMRHFDEITKINHSDSSVIWRMGGNANQFTFPNDTAMFLGQHDIRRIANGHVTLWDNGSANPAHYGSAKEYALDETNHIATLAWNYVEDSSSYSIAIGDVQRLPNGNTLIDYGVTAHEPRLFDVVDSLGNIDFEIQFDDTLRSYRAFNYQTLPWKLPRIQIGCVQIGNQFYLDAGSGHASYLWSTGDTTRMIPVTAADTFTVFVPVGNCGFMRSEDFIVTDTAAPCGPLTVPEHVAMHILTLSPNPVKDELHITLDTPQQNDDVIMIYDATGNLVYHSEHSFQKQFAIQVSEWPAGIYLIRVNDTSQKFIKIN